MAISLFESVKNMFAGATAVERTTAFKDKIPAITAQLERARQDLAALETETSAENGLRAIRGEELVIPKQLEKSRALVSALAAARDSLLANLTAAEKEAMAERIAELKSRVEIIKRKRSVDYARGMALHLAALKFFAAAGGEDLAMSMCIKGGSRIDTFYPDDSLDLVHAYFNELAKISAELTKLGVAAADRITQGHMPPDEASRFIEPDEAEHIADLVAEVHGALNWGTP